ncbi:Crp/Fnr family transcriptional regulator [Neolewinella antarctica]|uniref:CRP-like cAMP-binding protein n=1 Tax=Neolewinella antarctica TaxID=442734 RepID=A0ABX0XF49_9BACT|nr:cyclic nucleotide-binding domain-containing protein [Neolewinella antarctica]NJC27516.1 CRP-like cAMP-binding protein [Neolewinella antarctica]
MTSPITELHRYLDEHRLWYKTIELKRGEYLHRAGDRDGNIYHILSGTLRAYAIVNTDEAQTIRFAYVNDFYAAIDSFISGAPTILYGQALRKTTVRMTRRDVYQEHVMKNPQLAKLRHQMLGWMVTGQLEREIDLLTNDPAERYRRVLGRSPSFFRKSPQNTSLTIYG